MESEKNIHLLKSFFERLELAGIIVSPADYVRIANILELRLKEMLSDEGDFSDLKKLKFLITPLIARSKSDQKIVYEVFDEYLKDLRKFTAEYEQKHRSALGELITTSGADFSKPLSNRRLYIALSLLGIAIIGFVVSIIYNTEDYAWELDNLSAEWVLGDSLNISYAEIGADDEDEHVYDWKIFDHRDSLLKSARTNESSLDFVLDTSTQADQAYTIFSVFSEQEQLLFKDTTNPVSILCPDIPVLIGINVQGKLEKQQDILLSAVTEDSSLVETYHWTISNGDTTISSFGPEFYYNTGNAGVVNIELQAYGYTNGATCESLFFKALDLEQRTEPPFAQMELRALERYEGIEIAAFKSVVWIVWTLVFVLIIYFLWIHRKRLKFQREQTIQSLSKQKSSKRHDSPPYSIEFKSENKAIHSFEERSFLSRAMHERSSKPGFVLDVVQTLNSTIAEGGFPNVIYKNDSVPTQYLFLIHQNHKHSHGSRLFNHLADLMKEDDVLMLTMFYKDNPLRPYNKDYPEGISVNQLLSRYGNFRVLLFTEGEELINEYSGNSYGLDPELLELKSLFDNIYLVTPVDANSWSVRESKLYQIAEVFPAEVLGLLKLSKYLENDEREDTRKRFKDWRLEFINQKDSFSETFEDFKSPEPYKELLGSTMLYKWFLALSVFPTPNWDFTISVGKALEEKGLYLSFDNLLMLSRIPALHKASFHPSLLDKMRKELAQYPEIEKLTRLVLQIKLKEFDYQNMECFVAGSHELLTVKNNFLIAPEKEKNVNEVLRLVNEKRFSKLDLGDLVRHTVDKELSKSSGKKYREGIDKLHRELKKSIDHSERSKRRKLRWVGASLYSFSLFLMYCLHLIFVNDNTAKLGSAADDYALLNSMVNRTENLSAPMQVNNEAVDYFDGNKESLFQTLNDSSLIIGREVNSYLDSALVLSPKDDLISTNFYTNRLNFILTNLRYIEQENQWGTESTDEIIEEMYRFLYYSKYAPLGAEEAGGASVYDDKYQGENTASGDVYQSQLLTAAHKTIPFGSEVSVTRSDNNKSVIVRINDRGPYTSGRVVDLSKSAGEKIGLDILDTTLVMIQRVEDRSQFYGADSLYQHVYIPELTHLLGLAYFYNGAIVDAAHLRDSILQQSPDYFSTVSYSPTLLELLPQGAVAKQFKLEGVVLDAKGSPFENTKVLVGNYSTLTDEEGYYSLLVDNPLGLNRMEVVLETGGVFDKFISNQFISIGSKLSYNKDFTLQGSNIVNDSPQPVRGRPYDIRVSVFDDRLTGLRGVNLKVGDQEFIVDNSVRIRSSIQKGAAIQITAKKKGYKTYSRKVDLRNSIYRRKGMLDISLEKEPKLITVRGNVHDAIGQGLSGYSIKLGNACSTRSTGRDGRFSLSCELDPYEKIPETLVLTDPDGRIIEEKSFGTGRNYLFQVEEIKK